MKRFKVTRVIADENGESHFEHIDHPFDDEGPSCYRSVCVKVKEQMLRNTPQANDDLDKKQRRHFVILLEQGVEIVDSLDEKRFFPPGEILVMDDVIVEYHSDRNFKGTERNSMFIILVRRSAKKLSV